LLVPSPGTARCSWLAAFIGSGRRENAISPATPRARINKKPFQIEWGGATTGARATAIFIRLAAIPQTLADDFSLKTLHQAAAKTKENAVNSAGVNR